MMPDDPIWSCDDRGPRGECRNPHGCHCDEISDLVKQVAQLDAEKAALRYWLIRHTGWNNKQVQDAIKSAPKSN